MCNACNCATLTLRTCCNVPIDDGVHVGGLHELQRLIVHVKQFYVKGQLAFCDAWNRRFHGRCALSKRLTARSRAAEKPC